MINDGSVYENNFTLLQQIISLKRRVENLEAQSGGGGSDPYVLPTASATVKGGVKIGSGLSMNGEVLSATGGGSYELPVASQTTLGGIKVGEGLGINNAGYLFTTGGGSGGGKEVVPRGYLLPSNKIDYNNDTRGFLIGCVYGIRVPLKDYTTALTFVNDNDSSDTISLYLQNTSSGKTWMLANIANISGNWNLAIADTDGYITNPWGNGWSFSGSNSLVLYDTADQENAQPVAEWTNVVGGNGWIGTDSNSRFYVQSAYGNITQIRTEIRDSGNWKQYTWTGTIAYSDLVETGQETNAFLQGHWLYQKDIT